MTFPPSPLVTCAVGRVGPGVKSVGELPLPLTSGGSGPCTTPEQHSRVGFDGKGLVEPAGPEDVRTGDLAQALSSHSPWEGWPHTLSGQLCGAGPGGIGAGELAPRA